MTQAQITDVLTRIKRLECENGRMERAVHRWRLGAVAVACCAAVVLFAGAKFATVAKVVEAERFIVRDADGTARVEIGFGLEDGSVDGLQVRDKDGKLRTGIGVVAANGPLKDASGLAVFDQDEGLIVSIGAGAAGTASLNVFHPDRPGSLTAASDPPQATISFGGDTMDGVQLRDNNGKLRLGLGVITADGILKGASGLAIANQNEGVLMSMGTGPDGTALLSIFDNDKAVSLTEGLTGAPGTVIGAGQVLVLDEQATGLLERAYRALSERGSSDR